MSTTTTHDRDSFSAKPLSASEYMDLLAGDGSLVLRVSDETGDGTFRFWMDGGEFYWRCLNWGGPQQCNETHLSATLEDGTTQLLREGGENA